jgi:hypothetical protein
VRVCTAKEGKFKMTKDDLKYFDTQTLDKMSDNLYHEQLNIAAMLEAVRKEIERRNRVARGFIDQ